MKFNLTLAPLLSRSSFVACISLLACSLSVQAAVFNVREYGALADDKTDNTAAFSKCMDALIAAGGGQMLLPEGVYRGRITIPPVSKPMPSWLTVEIVGEGEPPAIFGTIGNFPLRNKGTILKCLDDSGPAVISAAPSPNALYMKFSGVHVVLRNLDVRTYDNPAISGIDLHHALQCRLENVFINTGVYNVQSSQPTHGTKGLVTPANNNAALTLLRNLTVTGYHTGIVVNEHTHGDHIVLGSNIHGLEFATAHHASRFDRVSAMRNTHHITVTGKHGFSIGQLNIENSGPGQTDARNEWQKVAHDLNDPQNLGTGDITYWVVLGGVGAVEDFTRNGGTHILTRRIGAEP
jgi:Pectate lyase superfamily protein